MAVLWLALLKAIMDCIETISLIDQRSETFYTNLYNGIIGNGAQVGIIQALADNMHILHANKVNSFSVCKCV